MISSSELIWVMVDQNWYIGVNCVEIWLTKIGTLV